MCEKEPESLVATEQVSKRLNQVECCMVTLLRANKSNWRTNNLKHIDQVHELCGHEQVILIQFIINCKETFCMCQEHCVTLPGTPLEK